ncbi:MAG: serine hydrolase [Pseudomonadota bacterium]
MVESASLQARRYVRLLLTLILYTLMQAQASAGGSLSDRLQAGVEDGSLKGLHSVLMMHDGEEFASAYFEGKDERWGMPLGMKVHGPDTRHDLRSVTKSIVGLLYAIARDEGIVPEPSASLVKQFPNYVDLAEDTERQKVTIEHALTMTMGMAWDESLPYTDPRNSEIAMEQSSDRYRFILEQDITGEPGKKLNYSGGATAIIGKLIANGAGMPLDEYANGRLFEPLGITEYTWIKGRDGEPSAASGLRMRAPDLAKIGQLIVDQGKFNGRQIVSENSLTEMLEPRAQIDTNFQYGHFWYLLGPIEKPTLAAGFGNGGQRLSVNAENKLVTVIFAGNYNDYNAWKLGVKVIEEYLVPELKKAGIL